MSLPQPPKKLIDYLPNGKTVCFDHHLRRCDICCVDFTYDESDEDDPYHIDNQDDSDDFAPGEEEEEDEEEDDRVFVLGGGVARFMPQWDEQVLGPANTFQMKQDYENPPKPLPLSKVATYHCPTCQLTWLVGEIGEAVVKTHPSHHSYSHIYAGTSRSILVFTDGACSGNGTSTARGGLGVFFGPGSKFNFAERLTGVQTSQKAELAAAARALETVRTKILPERRIMVTGAKGGKDPRAVKDVMHLRLVVVTDSSKYLSSHCTLIVSLFPRF